MDDATRSRTSAKITAERQAIETHIVESERLSAQSRQELLAAREWLRVQWARFDAGAGELGDDRQVRDSWAASEAPDPLTRQLVDGTLRGRDNPRRAL